MARLICATPRPYPSPDHAIRRVHPAKRTLREAAEAFLADCLARNLSPRTIEQYEWSLRSFRAFQPQEPVLAELTADACRAWSTSLSPSRRPTSVRSAVRALKVFSAWLPREGYLRRDPLASVRLPKAPSPMILPLSPSDVAALMAVSSPLLRAAIAVLADTGLRASELCSLTVEDIRHGFVLVRGKGGRERLVPYGSAAAAELTRYVTRSREPISNVDERLLVLPSGVPLTAHRLAELMREAGRRAGISGVRVSPHTLRHTFAIEFLRNGGGELALQKALGHATLEMVRVYADLTEVDLAKVHAGASPLDAWQQRGVFRGHPRGRPTRSSRRSRGESLVW